VADLKKAQADLLAAIERCKVRDDNSSTGAKHVNTEVLQSAVLALLADAIARKAG